MQPTAVTHPQRNRLARVAGCRLGDRITVDQQGVRDRIVTAKILGPRQAPAGHGRSEAVKHPDVTEATDVT